MPEQWWKNEDLVHYLVRVAEDFENDYEGRTILSVGHSPSWFAYTIGQIRKTKGSPENTHLIPFTGRYYQLDRGASNGNGRSVHFELNDLYTVSEQSLSGYFNHLARHGQDPACVMQAPSNGKPVIVDIASRGSGIVTFLDVYEDYAARQGVESLEETTDLVLFKKDFKEDRATLSFPARYDDKTSHRFDARIISGHAGNLFNGMAGDQGVPGRHPVMEKKVGRFMPYYPVVDGYNKESYLSNASAPISGLTPIEEHDQDEIETIKDAIQNAIEASDAVKAGYVEHAIATLEKSSAKPLGGPAGWVPIYRGYHG